jgi:hypothetical protein
MSRKTEKSYIYYILDYIYFHNKRHPQDMGVEEIRNSEILHHPNILPRNEFRGSKRPFNKLNSKLYLVKFLVHFNERFILALKLISERV